VNPTAVGSDFTSPAISITEETVVTSIYDGAAEVRIINCNHEDREEKARQKWKFFYSISSVRLRQSLSQLSPACNTEAPHIKTI